MRDLWVIFQRFNCHEVRRWSVRDDGSVGVDCEVGIAKSLESARELLPPGLRRADSRVLGVRQAAEAWQ